MAKKELAEKEEDQLEYFGEETEVKLNKWREEFGRRFKRFEIQEGEEVYVAYFKKPTLEVVQAADEIHPNDPVANNLYCYDNCHLGGSDRFINDDEYKFALARAISKSFRLLVGTVKNA